MKICESCGEEIDSTYDEFVCDGCLAFEEELEEDTPTP
jgi:predicted RNA-binding Zn-ribbon protein involved in translation (DUF1610 family)